MHSSFQKRSETETILIPSSASGFIANVHCKGGLVASLPGTGRAAGIEKFTTVLVAPGATFQPHFILHLLGFFRNRVGENQKKPGKTAKKVHGPLPRTRFLHIFTPRINGTRLKMITHTLLSPQSSQISQCFK